MKSKLIADFNEKSYIHHLDISSDFSGILFDFQFTGYEEIGKDYHLQRSEYNSFMLTYTISGESNLIYDGKYYKVEKDTLMFINCIKPHETWSNPKGYKIIYLHINNPMLDTFFKYITSIATPVIPLNNDEIGFYPLIKQMHQDISDNRFDPAIYSLKIYDLLIKLKTYVETLSGKLLIAPDYINKLVNFITTNYHHKLSLPILADHVNLTPNYLENVFSKYTGMPLAKYIANFRLKKSEYLLLNTNESILTIAHKVGLEDSQALIRLYKKNLGVTPLQYKKEKRKRMSR